MAPSAHLSIMPTPTVPHPQPAAEAVPVRPPLSLYAIEEQLSALVETLDAVPADQEEDLVARIGETLLQAVDQRDRMGQFLAHLEGQIGFADAEIKRLQERKQAFLKILERTEAYLVRVIQSLGRDHSGKWQKLERRTVTFSLRKQPPSVAVDNESEVPIACRKPRSSSPRRSGKSCWTRSTWILPGACWMARQTFRRDLAIGDQGSAGRRGGGAGRLPGDRGREAEAEDVRGAGSAAAAAAEPFPRPGARRRHGAEGLGLLLRAAVPLLPHCGGRSYHRLGRAEFERRNGIDFDVIAEGLFTEWSALRWSR
jgi:hypothetical protein